MNQHLHRSARVTAVVTCMVTLSVLTTFARAAGRLTQEPIAHTAMLAESVDLVRHGDFGQARRIVEKLAAETGAPDKAREWADTWLREEEQRVALTQKDYADYTQRAQKWFNKDDINKALKWTYWALLNTADDDSFRTLAWVHQVRDAAMTKADELYKEHAWRDAHEIYYALSLIFEKDEEIDKRRQDCLEHARLDEIYKTERDWAESLEGINKTMVEEALYRIDQKYVVEADFKAMTVAGFEELRLIADSPTLRDQFEGLRGDTGAQFVSRVESRLESIREQPELTYREALHHFRRALQINSQTAQLPEEMIVREYMGAALEKLDEFSSMIWPYDYREFEKHTSGNFVGVGIQIRNKYNSDLKDTEILVVSPLEDSPAYRAGIQADDIITKVNGDSLTGIPVTKAVSMITGPLHTTVTLTIRRTDGHGVDTDLEFPLRRENIRIQSVKSLTRRTDDEQHWDFLIDKEMGVAYVRVGSFQENTIDQLRTALEEARHRGMRGLILDLRYNPGGLLKTAVEMVEMFLPRDMRVVSTKGMRSQEWAQDTEVTGDFVHVPLIVLINGSSASASEIVSGAIHDHGRGLVIGERSFGKFSVQNLIQLVHSEAHLKLTTARYYLPSGRSLHREKDATEWGVEPDIDVPVVPKEESKIIFMRRDADVIGAVKTNSEAELDELRAPHADDEAAEDDAADGMAEEEEEAPDPNNRPRRDPQLETALLAMRMHLLSEDNTRIANMTPIELPKEVTNE